MWKEGIEHSKKTRTSKSKWSKLLWPHKVWGHAHSLHRPALGPLHVFYNFQFSVFVGFLSMEKSESLSLVSYLQFFFVCLFVYLLSPILTCCILFYFSLYIIVLYYIILYYFFILFHLILLSYLRSLFVFQRHKRLYLCGRRGRENCEITEGNHNQNILYDKKIYFQQKKNISEKGLWV